MKPRKLILSRKGFDSKAGGCPSPSFPEGTFYSLPIPIDGASITYGDLDHGGINIGQVVDDLTRGRLDAQDGVHLDPDIRQGAIRRHNAWRGMLGQTGAPEGHLEKQAVGAGDGGVVNRIQATAEKQGVDLGEAWKARASLELVGTWAENKTTLPAELLDTAEKLFRSINKAFYGPEESPRRSTR